MKTNNNILNKLPDTFKDKLKGLGVRKTSKMIHQLVKEYKILWNTLSREGQEMFAADPSTPIEKFNRADRSAIQHFEEMMAEWLE